jgi:excisionase family DNA binding protein
MQDSLLLSVEQAAERINLGRTKTFELIKSGDIESVTIGRLRRVPADAVEAYVARLRAGQRGVAA